MKLLIKVLLVVAVLIGPGWLQASDLTGVELILPAGFQFVAPDPSLTVDGSGAQLAARAPGGVRLSVRHYPDRKFLTSDIAGFFAEQKKGMAGQSLITMRSATRVVELNRTWGLAIIDLKSLKKALVQYLLVTSFQDTQLMFEFQGPKEREKFVESSVRSFMTSNPFRILTEPGAPSQAGDAPKNP